MKDYKLIGNQSTSPEKNYVIEAMRFLFCLFIINYHFFSHYLINIDFPNFFTRSYMGDEFFFIISGFYLAKAAYRNKNDAFLWNIKWFIKRLSKIAIPYYLTWIACFIGTRITNTITGDGNRFILYDLANSIYELLFLEMLGFDKGLYCNDVAWFFSALIIITFLIGPWIAKYKDKFALYCAPMISFISYGVLSLNFDYLYYPGKVIADSFIKKGLVRAAAAICIGIFLYGILQKEIILTFFENAKLGIRKVISFIDSLLWIIIFVYMIYPFKSRSAETWIQFDYIEVFLISIAIIPILGGMWQRKLSNRFETISRGLGKYAFYAYFGQAIFYSVDKLIYTMNIGIIYKALILNISIPIISLLLFAMTTVLRKMIAFSCKKYS